MAAKKKTTKKATKKKTTKKATKSAAANLTPLDKMELLLGKSKKISVEDMKVNLAIENLKKPNPHLPTGSFVIDYLIGGRPNKYGVSPCPGLPRGKITQVYGQNSCGKTTMALTAAATTCANGGTVLYIDLEHEVDPTYSATLNVPIADDSNFKIYSPNTLEEVLSIIIVATAMGVDLIIIDSVGAGITKETYQMSPDDLAAGTTGRLGQVAAFWSRALPIIKGKLKQSGTAMLGISQLRSGGPGKNELTIQGGKAWEFYTAVRIKLGRFSWEKASEYNAMSHKVESDVKIGAVIRAELQKCKVSQNQGQVQDLYIKHGYGIDDHHSILDVAVRYKVIQKGGSWYTWEDNKWQGSTPVLKYLRENPDSFISLYNEVMPHLQGATLADGEEEEIEDIEFDADKLMEAASGASSIDEALEIASEVAAEMEEEGEESYDEEDDDEPSPNSLESELDVMEQA